MHCANCNRIWTPRIGRRVEQRRPNQQRRRSIRRLLACVAGALPGDRLSGGVVGPKTLKEEACPQQRLRWLQQLSDQQADTTSQEEVAAEAIIRNVKLRRRPKRGYRIFHRAVSASGNYYSVPFPPPETLRLESDGDGKLWQDLEVRVISHEGVVVWQDMQTRSDDDRSTAAAAPQRHQRKFGRASAARRRRRPQSRSGPATTTAPPPAALLTIEATIRHWPAPLPPPPPPPPPLPYQQRARRQLAGTSSHSNATAGRPGVRPDVGDNWRPLQLLRQLRQMQQMQQMQQFKRPQHPKQQHRLQQRQLAKPIQRQQLSEIATTLLSKIPRLKPNWPQQQLKQTPQQRRQQQFDRHNWPNQREQELRRKLLQSLKQQLQLRQDQQQQLQQLQQQHEKTADHSVGIRRSQLLPSYMRPYSPVLHYPTPSQLPIAIHYIQRAARCVSIGGNAEATQSLGISQ